MIKSWLLVFLSLCFSFAGAQTKINGIVTGKGDGKGLQGVNVTVKERNAAGLLTYALTDEKGAYRLSFGSAADSVVITVSGFNLKKQAKTFVNKNQDLNFNVVYEAIKLKEIKVNPPKIRQLNDTLNYLVDGFLDKNDRTIGDVLRKMPGISVKDDGSITYNNKPINKFYIEGRDLLQGRYGIATNNIEAKDVATVQVLENHQPVKALKNREFTDEGAINLKLKDSAKGVLVANGQLGAGASPLLWNNELFSMFFNKARQNMNTYKGNNSGNDAAAELNSFYGDGGMKEGSMLSVQSPSSPGISQKRYLFNRTNAFSINNLWTYGKDYQVNANMSYLNDGQEKSSYSRSVYYLPGDSLLTIEESLAATAHIDLLDATVQLNTNKDKYYLDNSLKFTGKWSNEEGNVLSSENILQDLSKPLFKIGNTFTLIKNYRNINFKIYSYNGYSSMPQRLGVQPLLYEDLFDSGPLLDAMRQLLDQKHFLSSNKLSFGMGNGAWKQNYGVGINADLQQLRSELQARSVTGNFVGSAGPLSNQLHWNKYEVFVNPDYTYMKNNLKATISLPLVYSYLDRHDGLQEGLGDEDGNGGLAGGSGVEREENLSRLLFNPSVRIYYELGLFWNLNAAANYGNNIGGIENGFRGYIMQSYRNLVRNDGQLPEQKNQLYNMEMRYRHPVHAVFFNIGASYFRNQMNLLYGYDYVGILSLKKTYDAPNTAEGHSVYTGISKGIDAIASTVTLDVDYNGTAATQVSQGQVLHFMNVRYGLKSGISSKIGEWASLDYVFQYSKSKSRIRNERNDFIPIRSGMQRGQLNFFPAKGFTINLACENFYNSAIISGNKAMNFADAGAKYVYKKLEFNLEYANIFNVRQYVSASYDEISTFYSAYDLRPAQVLLKVRFKIK